MADVSGRPIGDVDAVESWIEYHAIEPVNFHH